MLAATALRAARALGLALALSLGLALAFAALVGEARADVPDVRFCTYDPVVLASPDGAFAYAVTVRDASSRPIEGATVLLDFNSVPGVLLCEVADDDHDRRLVALTGATGGVTFAPRAGGQAAGNVTIRVGGEFLAGVPVRTPDFDGDLDVDAADRAALAALVGTSNPAGDFDGDGTVDAADQAIFEQRFGATCDSAAPRVATWGAVKDLYR